MPNREELAAEHPAGYEAGQEFLPQDLWYEISYPKEDKKRKNYFLGDIQDAKL